MTITAHWLGHAECDTEGHCPVCCDWGTLGLVEVVQTVLDFGTITCYRHACGPACAALFASDPDLHHVPTGDEGTEYDPHSFR